MEERFKDAARNGKIDNMNPLIATQSPLNNPQLPNYLGRALVEAVKYEENEEMVELILKQNIEEKHIYQALRQNIQDGDLDQFKIILPHLQDINYCPNTKKKENNRPILLVAILALENKTSSCRTRKPSSASVYLSAFTAHSTQNSTDSVPAQQEKKSDNDLRFISKILQRKPNIHLVPPGYQDSILVKWARCKYFNTQHSKKVVLLIKDLKDAGKALEVAFHSNKNMFTTLLLALDQQYTQASVEQDKHICTNIEKALKMLCQKDIDCSKLTFYKSMFNKSALLALVPLEFKKSLITKLSLDKNTQHNTVLTLLVDQHVTWYMITAEHIKNFTNAGHNKSLANILIYIALNNIKHLDSMRNAIANIDEKSKEMILKQIIDTPDFLDIPMSLHNLLQTPIKLQYLAFKSFYDNNAPKNKNESIELSPTQEMEVLKNMQGAFFKQLEHLALELFYDNNAPKNKDESIELSSTQETEVLKNMQGASVKQLRSLAFQALYDKQEPKNEDESVKQLESLEPRALYNKHAAKNKDESIEPPSRKKTKDLYAVINEFVKYINEKIRLHSSKSEVPIYVQEAFVKFINEHVVNSISRVMVSKSAHQLNEVQASQAFCKGSLDISENPVY